MLIIFPALLGALTTAKEYEAGTIIQAYASSLTAVQWILGKALLYVLIGLVNLVLCFALGLLAFGFRIPTDPTVLLCTSFTDASPKRKSELGSFPHLRPCGCDLSAL
jgi:ABC-2 type transport system permease protein